MTLRCGCRRSGFTLIEVVGALVIFTFGVLITLNLTGSTSKRLSRAAMESELATRASNRLDSLATGDFNALTVGKEQRYYTVQGQSYLETVFVSSFSPLVREARIVLEPISGEGPRFFMTSYVSSEWQ